MSEGHTQLELALETQQASDVERGEDAVCHLQALIPEDESPLVSLLLEEKLEAVPLEHDQGSMTVQAAPMGAGAALSAYNPAAEVEITLQSGGCLLPVIEDEDDGVDQKQGVDGPYAWLICFFGCMNCMVLFGILTGFGVMLVPIAEDLGVSPADVSWLPTSINAIMVAVSTATIFMFH